MKIPSTVKSIEDRAFHDCKMLYSLELSVDITIKGFEVFHGCENLTVSCLFSLLFLRFHSETNKLFFFGNYRIFLLTVNPLFR